VAGAAVAAFLLVRHADDHGLPTPAAVNAVAIGTPRAAVIRRLGTPLAQADTTTTAGGPGPSCVIYAIDDRGAPVEHPGAIAVQVPYADLDLITAGTPQAVLCFARGRLTVRLPG
jgi:hypothetical protein